MNRILLLLVMISGLLPLKSIAQAPAEDPILTFLVTNPDRSSITLVRNDTAVVRMNADRLMPLASTVKIILAIEYAIQCDSGLLDPDMAVSLEELEKFHVPNTDGGAHPAWKSYVIGENVVDSIPLREVVKGMILFSSNANTEWLCEKLGLDRINKRVSLLGLDNHSEIFYIVSALFAGKEGFPGIKGKALEDSLRALTQEEYITLTSKVHESLSRDDNYKTDLGDLGMNIQKVWSDRLPASTTAEYVSLMKKINSREYFSEKTHEHLSEVLEWIMENPANASWLEHAGMKGGSTPFVLTKSLYALDREGNSTEMAYFLNDLQFSEFLQLQQYLNAFELKVLQNPSFIGEIHSLTRTLGK